jgi:hypothetical protein
MASQLFRPSSRYSLSLRRLQRVEGCVVARVSYVSGGGGVVGLDSHSERSLAVVLEVGGKKARLMLLEPLRSMQWSLVI